MTEIRLDCKATKIFALVHSDLADPNQPLAKDGYRYVLNFIDDYSGLTMLYFLKQVWYFACNNEISSRHHPLWTVNGMEFISEPFQ